MNGVRHFSFCDERVDLLVFLYIPLQKVNQLAGFSCGVYEIIEVQVLLQVDLGLGLSYQF